MSTNRSRHVATRAFLAALWIVSTISSSRVAAAEFDFDVLIRHGRVIDGSGQAEARADVGIREGRIAAIGDLSGKTAKDTIEAEGRVVCPGFIDLHSHGDGGILQFRSAENVIRQGVTTLVCGNCGSSPVNVREFFDKLRDGGTGPNIAIQIGHGSVRRAVIGPLNVPPNESQLAEMRALVRQAMQDGAVGMSTGLVYSPSSYAGTDELVALAKELAPFGGFYATHMRDEGTRVLEALEEALQIGAAAGVPVHISHHKISSASVFGLTRQTLARIDRARAEKRDVTLDQYPYAAGSGGLAFYVPQSSMSGGIEAYRKRIVDPAQRAEIVEAVEEVFRLKLFEVGQSPDRPADIARALARIQIARAEFDRTIEGQRIGQILQKRQQELSVHNAAELLVDLVGREVGGINHTLDGEPGGDVDRVMQHPFTSIASDGSVLEFGKGHPHPRCYGCYPRVLGHYVRERKLLSLEQAIHKMTGLPAQRLSWADRGTLRSGNWADVVVFNPETIVDRATFVEPHQQSVGVEHVLVNGRFVLRSETMTNERPGRPVGRGPNTDAAKP